MENQLKNAPTSQVDEQLTVLESELDNLEHMLEKTIARLEKVLTPEPPKQDAEKIPAEGLVPLAYRIRGSYTRVIVLHDVVHDLLGRIEV